MSSTESLDKLHSAILNFDADEVNRAAKLIIASGVDPLRAVSALSEAMREVGRKFAESEIFLADLMIAGDCMKSGMDVILPAIPKGRTRATESVLIGTVKGDVHDIGKTIVISMLMANGFQVHDIGVDLAVSKFAEEATKTHSAIVAASAIMTTTMPLLKDLVEYFQALGIRSNHKILVGGGPVTREYARQIGADGYGADAIEAAEAAKELVLRKSD